MSKITTIIGYTLAALAVPLVLVTFIGGQFWAETLVSVTGITVSPWVTGGEVARQVNHGAYQTSIHRPVFDWLIGQRPDGFVQVDWAPLGALPVQIVEDVDFDGDGQRDFHIVVDTQTLKGALTPYSPRVVGLEGVYRLPQALAIRVSLRNAP